MLGGMGGIVPSHTDDLARLYRGEQFHIRKGNPGFLALIFIEQISLQQADLVLEDPTRLRFSRILVAETHKSHGYSFE